MPGLSDDPLGLRFIASDDLNTYLFEARQILEPSVCRLAAQRGDAEELVLLKQLAEDIDELDAQLRGKKTTPEVIQAITAKDIAFHTFLCRMSKNPVFERMLPVITNRCGLLTACWFPVCLTVLGCPFTERSTKRWQPTTGTNAYRLMVAHLSNSRQGFDQKVKKERNAKGGKTELPQKQ